MPGEAGRYLAVPSPQPGGWNPRRPGVLVVHHWYGLLPRVERACDQLVAAWSATVEFLGSHLDGGGRG